MEGAYRGEQLRARRTARFTTRNGAHMHNTQLALKAVHITPPRECRRVAAFVLVCIAVAMVFTQAPAFTLHARSMHKAFTQHAHA